MRRIVTYEPTLGETALLILADVGDLFGGIAKSFFPHPYYHSFCEHARPRSFENALRRFQKRRFIELRRHGNQEEWCLTEKGRQRAAVLQRRMKFQNSKRWDRKWRLVIFDVPETIRGKRDFLRRELRALGFYQLQKSVWVTPDPLPADFATIMAELDLDNFRIVVAERLDHDNDLQSIFFKT